MTKKTAQSEKKYECEFCGSKFVREKTLFSHVCEKKRRNRQKDEKHVRMGFGAFNRFYQLNVGGNKENKTYKEFCDSQYYNAFVKFGSYITNVKPLYPEKYIDYILKSGVKIDKWVSDELYEKYALDIILKEDATVALERSITTMVEWASEKNNIYNAYFLEATTNRLVRDIKDGKISPWVLLLSASGQTALEKMNEEQLNMIYHIIDPGHWSKKFKIKKDDVSLIKSILKEANI